MSRRPRRGLRLAARAALVLLLLGACAAWLAREQVGEALSRAYFAPWDRVGRLPFEEGAPHEPAWLVADDGSALATWIFPALDAEGARLDPPRGVVVHAHGNAANLTWQWRSAADLARRGFLVLAFDYRGFGESEGEVSRRAACADLRVALEEGARLARARCAPLHVVAQSMGASLALETLGARGEALDVDALVLDSPFSRWGEVGARALAGDGLAAAGLARVLDVFVGAGRVEPVEAASGLPARARVLVVAGVEDRICPVGMARAIASAADATLVELEGAPHVGWRGRRTDSDVDDLTAAFLAHVVPLPAPRHGQIVAPLPRGGSAHAR